MDNKSENIKLLEIPEIEFKEDSNELKYLTEIYDTLH